MDIFITLAAGLLGLVGVGLAAIFLEARRSTMMINEWADEHGYEVVEKKQPLVNLGPYRWENPRGRTFYHVTVRDGQGQEHGGWVRCGAEWLGLFANRIEMRWDNGEPPQTASRSGQVDEGVWPPAPTE